MLSKTVQVVAITHAIFSWSHAILFKQMLTMYPLHFVKIEKSKRTNINGMQFQGDCHKQL